MARAATSIVKARFESGKNFILNGIEGIAYDGCIHSGRHSSAKTYQTSWNNIRGGRLRRRLR
jgi:hypothetical protein